MKKRKKPIFLVAVLALLAVTVIAINASSLASKKNPEDMQADANAQQAAQLQQTNQQSSAQSAITPKPLTMPDAEDTPDSPMNVKPVPAVAADAPKILAPKTFKNVIKDPEHASTQPNSGWYMNGK